MMKSVELVFDSVGGAGGEGGFEFTGDKGGDGFLAGGDNLAGDGVGLGELQGHRGEFAG